MNDGSTCVTFTIPAHPDDQQATRLRQRSMLQSRVRAEVWRHVRTLLCPVGADGLMLRPTPLEAKSFLTQMLPSLCGVHEEGQKLPNLAVKNQAERAVRDELARWKALPERLSLQDLQPPHDLDQLVLPGWPCFVSDTHLLVEEGFAVEADGFALPQPFAQVLRALGSERMKKWRTCVDEDLATLRAAGGQVSPAEAEVFWRHFPTTSPGVWEIARTSRLSRA